MTQAAVNNAIVLYRLAVERRDVEEAQRVYFVTEKLAQTLANPLIPLTKKYDIIEKVYGFESEPKLITSFIKEMVKLGYAAEMNEIFGGERVKLNSTLMEMKNIQQYVEQEWKTISEVPGVSHQMKMAEL